MPNKKSFPGDAISAPEYFQKSFIFDLLPGAIGNLTANKAKPRLHATGKTNAYCDLLTNVTATGNGGRLRLRARVARFGLVWICVLRFRCNGLY